MIVVDERQCELPPRSLFGRMRPTENVMTAAGSISLPVGKTIVLQMLKCFFEKRTVLAK